ncbi:MAG: VWA domain-containing protein [Deltaproteobacteria bacterium]|nr:VWA domain-containing protein [Deltaproteobacteria bacterium]
MVQDFFIEIVSRLYPGPGQVLFASKAMLWLSVLAVIPAVLALVKHAELGWARVIPIALSRVLFVVAVVLLLAGPKRVEKKESLDMVVAIDASMSISNSRLKAEKEAASKLVDEALSQGAGKANVILFSDTAAILPLPAGQKDIKALITGAKRPPGRGTDIAGALRRSYPMLGANAARVVVLFSDGNQTSGDIKQEALRAASLGIKLYAFNPKAPVGGIRLLSISAPKEVRASKEVRITAKVHSDRAVMSHVSLWKAKEKIAEKKVRLKKGKNEIDFKINAPGEPGLLDYKVVARAWPPDVQRMNDVLATRIQVEPRPKILILRPKNRPGSNMTGLLKSLDADIDEKPIDDFPPDMYGLVQYDLVVLDEPSAKDLDGPAVKRLGKYLQDMAGGLLFIGGKRSKDISAKQEAPIEHLLPLRLKRRKKREKLSLAMVLVIDRSGSMARDDKFVAALRAAHAAIDELKDEVRVALVLFADEPEVVLPLTLAKKRKEIDAALEGLEVGGGTSIYPALEKAYEILKGVDAKVKHILLLTDGESVSRFEQHTDLVEEMTSKKMTISTVALGPDAERRHLRRLAAAGGGRYYYAPTPDKVPKIFTRETRTVSETGAVERKSEIAAAKRSDILKGLAIENAPPFSGLLYGEIKPAAELILETKKHEPLLARWRYGLGQVVMFTSDCFGPWTSTWNNFSKAAELFRRMAGAGIRRNRISSLSINARPVRDHVEITVSGREGASGLPAPDALDLVVVDPLLKTEKLKMKRLGTATYSARYVPKRPGPYLYRIEHVVHGKVIESATARLVEAYPEEFASEHDAVDVLKKACQLTGGKLNPSPMEIFQDKVTNKKTISLGNSLIYFALGLLLFETAIRRV